jgi:hypothetical protein
MILLYDWLALLLDSSGPPHCSRLLADVELLLQLALLAASGAQYSLTVGGMVHQRGKKQQRSVLHVYGNHKELIVGQRLAERVGDAWQPSHATKAHLFTALDNRCCDACLLLMVLCRECCQPVAADATQGDSCSK